jgi:hypothetical protein
VKLLLAVVVIASGAGAQVNGRIEGPVLGMIFDPDAAGLRLLEGIPGSARLGRTLQGLPELATAAVAANRGYGLGIERNGEAVLISGEGARPLADARTGANQVIVSPRGTAAALVFRGEVQIFTGMPEAPQLKRTAMLEDTTALALSDDGEVLLAIARGRRSGDTIYAHRASGPEVFYRTIYAHRASGPEVFYRTGRLSAAAFVPEKHNVLLADATGVKLVRPDLGEQPASADVDGRITAVAASADGFRVFAVSSSGRVTIHDLRSATTVEVRCACVPRTLAPLRGNAVFRLNESGDGPLWVLDADGIEPRIAFVASSGESR